MTSQNLPKTSRPDVTELELTGGREKRELFLADADPQWARRFDRLAEHIRSLLGSCALAVHHIGSTSVPGLAAKPIIDIAVTVSDITAEEDYLDPLLSGGYVLRVREPEHRMVRTPARDVHIHIYPAGHRAIADYLVFRNQLRADRRDRELYERTKRRLVTRDWIHMDAYAEAKTEVVEAIRARGVARQQAVVPGSQGPAARN